jgi:uncharacterized protein DUF1579
VTVAAGMFTIATLSAQILVAQAGGEAGRSVELPLTTSLDPSHLERARGILRTLAGTWKFEIWFAGNFDGAPDASGTRVMTTLFDGLYAAWTEEVDHSQIHGQGLIGFDPGSDRFFSAAVYSVGSAPEFMSGILDTTGPRITFSPISVSPPANPGEQLSRSSELSMLDRDHFTWAALDRGWRAVFTRQAAF